MPGWPAGTTPAHVVLGEFIAANVRHAYLCLDADTAGRQMAERYRPVLEAMHISVTRVHLPEGTDLADNLHDSENPTDYLANLLAEAEAAVEAVAA